MKRILIAALIVHTYAVQADAVSSTISDIYQVAQCPAVGEDYEMMVAKLDSIKAAIKDTGNCKSVTLQVDSLQKLLDEDRQKAIDIADKSQESGLTKEDSQFIKDYAEGLTKKVASLGDLFLRSNQCFAEDAPNPLNSLAGFVGEASSLIGSVAGPWGAPIALAGNVIAGFLSGLNDIMKTRAGYDFSKRDQWMTYVQNLCTYHTYREQVEHLLDPNGRLQQLRKLQVELDRQIATMSNTCSDCANMSMAFAANQDLPTNQIKALFERQVTAANAQFTKPLGSFMLQSLGLRNWVEGEIIRVQKASQSDWGNPSGQYILTRAKDELEDFLIKREGPEFLYYQTGQSRNEYQSLVGYINSDGRALYNEIERTQRSAVTPVPRSRTNPLDYLTALVLNPIQWNRMPSTETTEDLKYAWMNFRAESVLGLRRSQTTARVALSFCNFFKHTNQYNSSIRSACTESGFKNLVEAQIKMDQDILKAGANNPDLEISSLGVFDLSDQQEYARNPIEALIKTIEGRAQ